MESGEHLVQLIYIASDALTPAPPGTRRGLVNSLYRKEPARTPRKGVKAKCSWGEGDKANAEKNQKGQPCIGVDWPYWDCDCDWVELPFAAMD